MPIKDGQKVYFCSEKEIIESFGLNNIKNPIPAGFIEMSNKISVPINFNSDFLIGPEGAHLNISGISGLATKTSYAMFLFQALQQTMTDVAFVVLNVKGFDLLRLDENNPHLTDFQEKEYERCGIECKPFDNVKYYYPFQNNNDRYLSSSHLKKEVLEAKHNSNRAHNFIYTYEENADSLDLLFSSIDDPAQTMESILSYVGENPNFQGFTWD